MRRNRFTSFVGGADDAQAIVLVALLLTSLMGFVGLVVDVGWYQLNLVRKYATSGTGQDVTTWSVNIRGNPVHLVTP